MDRFLLSAGALLAVLPGVSANNRGKQAKPNVLFIAVDDLKPVLGCYGDMVAHSPNIDALAARSSVFTSCYCQQAVSAPTRASLLTGVRPDSTKVWDLKTLIRDKNPDILTLPQYFLMNGYETAGIGKIFDSRSVDRKRDERSWSVPYMEHMKYRDTEHPIWNGYVNPETVATAQLHIPEANAKGLKGKARQDYVGKFIKPSTECEDVSDETYVDGATAKGAIDYLRNRRPSDKPFFLAVGFQRPHLPFVAPKKYWDLYDRDKMPLAEYRKRAVGSPAIANHKSGELHQYSDIPAVYEFTDIDNTILPESKQKELIHGYYAAMSYMDAQLGKVLAELDAQGLRDNTIIVLWGDHGWHLGDHGLWNKHSDFENATHVPMMICVPGVKPGRYSAPVEFLDIFPTLCEAVGIKVPKNLDGTSLFSCMRSSREPSLDQAVSQWPGKQGSMGYSFRTPRYRYTIWVNWNKRHLDPDDVMAEELYDYQNDPLEKVNHINEPEYAAAAAEMRARWKKYRAEKIRR